MPEQCFKMTHIVFHPLTRETSMVVLISSVKVQLYMPQNCTDKYHARSDEGIAPIIQGVSGGIVNIFGGCSVDYSE
jgi:hypothetical protein